MLFFFLVGLQSIASKGLLIHYVSRSHPTKHKSR